MSFKNNNNLPDFNLSLKQCRDFIINSPLARKALTYNNKDLKGQFNVFISDLIESIDKLSDSCHMPEFTDHGLPHLCSLIERVSSWSLKNGKMLVDRFTKKDCALLLLGLLIHDLGMLSQKEEHLSNESKNKRKPDQNLSGWVRKTHVERLKKLFKGEIKELGYDFKDTAFIDDAITIAEAHNVWPWDWNSNLKLIDKKLKFLASVISVVDLLDEDGSRCDTLTLITHKDGTELNKAHWLRHSLTPDRLKVLNGDIGITMVKPPKWKDNEYLKPLYAALRNHFRIINHYNDNLTISNINASITLIFNPEEGIPEIENKDLTNWRDIEGFNTEKAFVSQVLNTFMNLAVDESYEPQVKGFEIVQLDCFHKLKDSFPRIEYERTFLVLMNDSPQEAYTYLKKKAFLYHKENDPYMVLFLSQLAIEKIINNITKLTFDDWHWAFSCFIYWNNYSLYNSPVIQKFFEIVNGNISNITNSKKKPIKYYNNSHSRIIEKIINEYDIGCETQSILSYAYLVLKIMACISDDIEFSSQKLPGIVPSNNEMIPAEYCFSKFLLFYTPNCPIDIDLLCYISELHFVKYYDKNKWLDFHKQFEKRNDMPEEIKVKMQETKERFCLQSEMLFNESILPLDDILSNNEKYKCFHHYSKLEIGDLFNSLQEIKNNFEINSNEYGIWNYLMIYVYFYNSGTLKDELKEYNWIIERYKYKICAAESKEVVFQNDFDINLNNYFKLNGTINESELKRLNQTLFQSLLLSLRFWSLQHFDKSCKSIAQFFLFSKKGILSLKYQLATNVHLSKSPSLKDAEKKAVGLLRFSSKEEIKEFFKYLLNFKNLKVYDIHNLIEKEIYDLVPIEVLPQLADWSLKLETGQIQTTGMKAYWLEFWDKIFDNVDYKNEYVKEAALKLSETVFEKSLSINIVMLQGYHKLATQIIIILNNDECQQFIDGLKENYINDAKSYIWDIIYKTSKYHKNIHENNKDWLESKATDDKYKQQQLKSLSSKGLTREEESNEYYRNAHIEFWKNTLISINSTPSISDIHSHIDQLLQLGGLCWYDEESESFTKLIVEAYNSDNSSLREKWFLLGGLSGVLSNCSDAIHDLVVDSIDFENLDDRIVEFPSFNSPPTPQIRSLSSLHFSLIYHLLKVNKIKNNCKVLDGIKTYIIKQKINVSDSYIYALVGATLSLGMRSVQDIALYTNKAQMLIDNIINFYADHINGKNPNRIDYTMEIENIICFIKDFIKEGSQPSYYHQLNEIDIYAREEILNFFEYNLSNFAKYSESKIRKNIADVLLDWQSNSPFEFNDNLKSIMNNLKEDPSSLVRKVFLDK